MTQAKSYIEDSKLLEIFNKGLSAEEIQKKTDLSKWTLQSQWAELSLNPEESLKKPEGLLSHLFY
jgi:hypothetical protein